MTCPPRGLPVHRLSASRRRCKFPNCPVEYRRRQWQPTVSNFPRWFRFRDKSSQLRASFTAVAMSRSQSSLAVPSVAHARHCFPRMAGEGSTTTPKRSGGELLIVGLSPMIPMDNCRCSSASHIKLPALVIFYRLHAPEIWMLLQIDR